MLTPDLRAALFRPPRPGASGWREPRAPSPAGLASELDDSPSEDGFYSRLSQGFLEVMSPAIKLLTKGVPGKIAGGLLAVILFVPAVLVGGIHAMF